MEIGFAVDNLMSEEIQEENMVITKPKRLIMRCFIGLLVVLCPILLVYSFLLYESPYARRASGANDIFPAWQGCTAYAKEHDGLLPPLDPELGRLMFERTIMSTQYGVSGLSVTCEYDETAPIPQRAYRENADFTKDPNLIDDFSWWYLGYEIHNEEKGRAFALAYLKRVLDCGNFESDLPGANGSTITFTRLHSLPDSNGSKDKPNQTVNESLDNIPVFVERPGHYGRLKGGHVIYRDGHQEYIEYPGKFPMSKSFIETLELLDKLGMCQKK